ncbi:Reticulon-like protein B9 [Raphanus sativus]|uniref:Reticulon-like protein n=1 Tax=Raphanus sativus TaxID=3726 RepID=A0A6J0JTW7_RAPSA|nr:reticulon-like protein B9 [Raphanus sativus]KAJ4874231.1 Reticulon-like protein B9 [Raphanus sativus]
MPIFGGSSDSEDERTMHQQTKLFYRQRSIHSIFGGGKVADILLWREPKIAATLVIGVSLLWFLMEVVEYNFITLVCHASMTSMLLFFIWSTASDFLNWERPIIPEVVLDESSFKELATSFHDRFNQILSKLLDLACGRDPPLFFLTTISLYILSIIGTCINFMNLLFIGFVSMQTLPVMYEMYEDDVDRVVSKFMRKMRKLYRKVDSNVLRKIPRGTVRSKKHT